MFARVSRFRGSPESIEQAAATYREQALPWMRDATGFRGWMVLLDREGGSAIGLTFWSDAAAMRDSVASGGALRDEIAESAGTRMESLEYFEVAAADGLALEELQRRPPEETG